MGTKGEPTTFVYSAHQFNYLRTFALSYSLPITHYNPFETSETKIDDENGQFRHLRLLVGDDKIGVRTTTMQNTCTGQAKHDPTHTAARSRYWRTLENLAIVVYFGGYTIIEMWSTPARVSSCYSGPGSPRRHFAPLPTAVCAFIFHHDNNLVLVRPTIPHF